MKPFTQSSQCFMIRHTVFGRKTNPCLLMSGRVCSGKRGYHYKKVNDKEIHYLRHTCSPKCKPLTQDEVGSILSFKQAFDNPIDEVIQTLYECDTGCPNTHHYHIMFRPNGSTELVGKQGHPLSCYREHTGEYSGVGLSITQCCYSF